MTRSLTTFLVIRHAQSANNALPEHQRVCDPGLTPLGIQQANALAEFLRREPIAKIYCSGFLRSIETAAPLSSRLNIPVYVHSKLFEVKGCYSGYLAEHMRSEPGLGRAQILAKYSHWEIDEAIDDNGWNFGRQLELDHEADERAAEVASWMRDLHIKKVAGGSQIAMVIHADFKVKLLNAIVDLGAQTFANARPWNDYDPHNTSITRVSFSEHAIQIHEYNTVDHLKAMQE